MARNDGVDRTTVRNQPRTESNIADAEAHNERQKACYRNEDIVPEHSHLNIHFKTPSGSYQEMFQQMEQNGTALTQMESAMSGTYNWPDDPWPWDYEQED